MGQGRASRREAPDSYHESVRGGASAEALSNSAINSLRQRRAELAAEYRRLMTQFEPGYPAAQAIQAQITQLDRSIASEEGRVTSSLLADYRRTQEQEQALQAKIGRAHG